ncbi:BON domain-containing protein [Thalassotalea agarivorans]|uniref:Osmotically-inducible protein OsmY, contains BON domain n=1 Tax=Thalassotalea agarivorans TaxID=349064 RepID=A0A1H9Y3P5_THASX|nr:BON domain-containing protein [Thalassotalea agarivorans]SES63375.1 Osmotically-inducible protein OsmY, contains BON domain [Thalassotalea agarivorans]
MQAVKLYSTLLLLFVLQGCAAAAAVAVIGGATLATDERSLEQQAIDQQNEIEAAATFAEDEALNEQTNLTAISMNGKMLIVGQAPTRLLRDSAIRQIGEIKGVEKLYDQIRISNITTFTTRRNDEWLTTKVKTLLFGGDHVNATNVKVVTENGEVFLMGLVTEKQAAEAVEIARNISGVHRVYRLFEIIPE